MSSQNPISELLLPWLEERLQPPQVEWLHEKLELVRSGNERGTILAFGMASRKASKQELALDEEQLQKASQVRQGWNPKDWTVDQTVRTLLLLELPHEDPVAFRTVLDKLFSAGEVRELVALYQALPLLPHPELHRERAAEGIRTNMKAIFCAVAHNNPYPAEQLDQNSWNQMILKCLFIGVPLDPVVGIDGRSNPKLARMLCDYAHERWAAGRVVSPELWRPVGPHADENGLQDLERVLETGTDGEKMAAALALMQNPEPSAKQILQTHPQVAAAVQERNFTWTKAAALARNMPS